MNTHRTPGPALTSREPVATTATITAAVAAIIGLLVAFGVPVSDDQREAILVLVGIIAPLAVTIARRWVTPNARVVEREQDGLVVAGEGHDTLYPGEHVREHHS